MILAHAAAGAAGLVSSEVAEFEALVARQSSFVFRIAYAILRNRHDAEDAVQETFMKLYRSRAWTAMDDERAFLARTAWRIAVDRLPRHRPLTAEVEFEPASCGPGPDEQAIATSRHAMIHRIIDSLPEELRQPLALSALEELNSREIALILGVPEGTVRTRLMRARQMLKQKLAGMMEYRNA
ncbi:MAG: sigma-70 family RNA polymerase sigma factor [Silvibacterium sp.]|nr:sigma-70 family RNA polymerase sigma factor [Silvibacterium sp.]MBV8437543.1 sigma-70 family RNA polymerase sigma factor [Silvibacterium sp.]